MKFVGDLEFFDELTGSRLVEDREALLQEMCRCGGGDAPRSGVQTDRAGETFAQLLRLHSESFRE